MSAPTISVILPILAPTPFLRALAEFSIKTLRINAAFPDRYELIVAEAGAEHFDPKTSGGTSREELRIDKYLGFVPPRGGIRETNAAIDRAEGEFVLFTGTDVIVPGGWDDELLRIFAERHDCGAASLSAFEPNYTIGPRAPIPPEQIPSGMVEGMFSPFTMFRRGWRLDEAYQRIYQDSDLIMRMREKGLHPYRSVRKHLWHLGSVTNTGAGPEHAAAHARALAHDERLFYKRWGASPTATFAMIRAGSQIYGREHEAALAKIALHYDPSKADE